MGSLDQIAHWEWGDQVMCFVPSGLKASADSVGISGRFSSLPTPLENLGQWVVQVERCPVGEGTGMNSQLVPHQLGACVIQLGVCVIQLGVLMMCCCCFSVGWSLRSCISNRLPGAAAAIGWTTL